MTAGDPSSSWRTLLMETLAPASEPTLIASDGAPREWAGLPRMSGNRLLAEKIRSVVVRVHESRTVVDVVVGPRRNQHVRVIGTPVIGPAERVHAVNLGVGDPYIEPPRPRPAAAFGWSAASRLISLGRELTDSEADPLIAGRLWLTAPEMFRHVVKLDAAVTLIAKALAPVPADRWAGTATIDTPMGDRAVHLAMRSMPAPDQQSWRGVLHDVTDTVAPQPPTLDAITLSAMAARGGKTAAALMDLTLGAPDQLAHRPGPGHSVERDHRQPRHPTTAGRRPHPRRIRTVEKRHQPNPTRRDPVAPPGRRVVHRRRSVHPHLRHSNPSGHPGGNDPHHHTASTATPRLIHPRCPGW